MVYETILYDRSGPVATITLNRPDTLNAISPQMTAELHRALDEADADREVRAIILTGAGRGFSAGYDIARRPDGRAPLDGTGVEHAEFIHDWWTRDAASAQRLIHLWHLTTPVIAAVHGWVMGGGFWYSLAADITIAADNAVFAQPEVRHTSNTTILFAALAGWKAAHRYGLTGDHLDAAEALRLGLVNEVVPLRSAPAQGARARRADRPGAGAVGAAEQGHHLLWPAGDGAGRGDAHERPVLGHGPRLLRRAARRAAGADADRRTEGVPGGPRRRVPSGAVRPQVGTPAIVTPPRKARRVT